MFITRSILKKRIKTSLTGTVLSNSRYSLTVMTSKDSRIDENTINSLVKSASYAVRGKIVGLAAQIAEKIKNDPKHGYPFNKIISCNIGNPHSLEQKPMTFMRDVLSIVVNPSLKERCKFPKDVLQRADRYLSNMPGLGAYSESQGFSTVREDIAAFIERRDGFPADASSIFLTNGASEGVRFCMQTILRSPAQGFLDGVLTPIPQYPLYSALTTLLEGNLVPYYLDESRGWACSLESLRESLQKARSQGILVRALVVINPGNPTGQVMDVESMREVVSFCSEEGICLLADEVYQENIWRNGAKFTSFRKVVHDMGITEDSKKLQMISFHSVSKVNIRRSSIYVKSFVSFNKCLWCLQGFLGECGLRGGYYEIFGIPDGVKQELYKLASISLCSNTAGQIMTGLMVHPPYPGDESYPLYAEEREAILQSMKRRADALSIALHSLDGMSCTSIDGAMYAFPTIELPRKSLWHRLPCT